MPFPGRKGRGIAPSKRGPRASTTVAGPDDYTCTQTRRRKVILISPDPDKYSTLAFGFICCIAATSSVTPPHSVKTVPLTASAVHHKRLSGLRTSCAAGIVSKVRLLHHPGTRIEDQHGNQKPSRKFTLLSASGIRYLAFGGSTTSSFG